MFLPHTRFNVSNMAGVLQEAETAYSSGAPESGGFHVVHLFLAFSVVSVLFLSCPCCSPEFVGNC